MIVALSTTSRYDGRMTDDLDDQRLAAWEAFVYAHAAVVDRIERELTAAGVVPLGWYDVLVALAPAPGHRLRMHELAREVVLSRSGLTRLVDRLAAAGLLCRQPDPSDRRGAFAALTPEGLAAQQRAWPVYARAIAAHFGRHLSEDEARTLAGALDRVRAAGREG